MTVENKSKLTYPLEESVSTALQMLILLLYALLLHNSIICIITMHTNMKVPNSDDKQFARYIDKCNLCDRGWILTTWNYLKEF